MTRLILLLSLLFAPSAFALSDSVLLEAIAMVETGNRADVRGAAGERGPWQLTPAVRARVGGHDYKAALKWLRVVKADMARYGIHVCPFNVGLAWNVGVHGVRRGRVPMSSYDYALRVDRLYHALLSERTDSRLTNAPISFTLSP